jgi:hypothetical protein
MPGSEESPPWEYEDGLWEALKVIGDGTLLGLYVTFTSLPAQLAIYEVPFLKLLKALALTSLISGAPQIFRHMLQKRNLDVPDNPE